MKVVIMKTKIICSTIAGLTLMGALFNGCSSGGATDSTTATTTLDGFFVDSAVEGLSYKSVLSGITDSNGRYSFQGVDRVEFLLGDKLSLGTLAPKTSTVSVLDFFDNTKTIDDPEIQNLLVLLQSLDSDGDVSNGITILPETITILEGLLAAAPYNVTDLTTFDFSTMTLVDLNTLLTAVVAATPSPDDALVDVADAIAHFTQTLYGVQPPVTPIVGTLLACDDAANATELGNNVADAADYNASDVLTRNISSNGNTNLEREKGNSHNSFERLSVVVDATKADGTPVGGAQVHPLIVSYNEQVVGEYEMGDGSADIGDPTQRDALYISISLDNGDTWKKQKISHSETHSSKQVTWDGTPLDYSGHTQKPTMAVEGNNILLAWNDKFCPSNNPFNLTQDANNNFPSDVFAVNGEQGSIDYEAIVAPNEKVVYEVPFSCVWTARGFFNPTDGNVTWHAPKQLTSGTRDSNHIWLEGSAVGFAMSWQEDTIGLRSGKGEGPGAGWSGATTNRGSDIWYTSIKLADLDAQAGTDLEINKPISLNNFHYPVRITDNEKCTDNDTKPYCQPMCDGYGSTSLTSGSGSTITRCNTYDVDMLTNTRVVLDGDTGASRSAIKILETDANEHIVIMGYEETKSLSEDDTATNDTNISVEGKSVYFESFPFDAIDSFDENNVSTILTTPMPIVSAGNIINIKVPDQNTSELIYENARRLVIGTQINSCDANKFTFAFMYKQSFDTQGASSDMFIRVNNGFTYDSFIAMDERNVTNVSAQVPIVIDDITDYTVNWSSANLDDNSYDNTNDNTFSPRIFLRGNNIYTGFEYTPNESETKLENMPSNFHTHIYLDTDGGWQGPKNITQVVKTGATTVDARFFSTPKGSSTTTFLDSDRSNPNVLFVTWGDVDFIDDSNQSQGKAESNLWYKRSTDNGATWDTSATQLAAREGAIIQEKEVASFASPDGKTIYNVWLQEEANKDLDDPYSGLDSWFGRVDYNISN